MEDTPKKKYSLTTENISLPTFFNNELEEVMEKPVTPTSLIANLKSLIDITDKAEQSYLDLVKKNIHQFNDLINSNKRGVLSYFFYFEELKRMVFIILNKFQIQQGQDGSAIAHFRGQTSKDVIDSIPTDEDLSYIITQQYRDQNPIKQLLASLLDLEQKILMSNQKIGMVIMNKTTIYAKYLIREIFNNIFQFKDLASYESKDKKQMLNNELILLNLIISLDKIKLLSIALHNSYFVDENDIINIPEDNERWKQIKKIMVRVVSEDEDAVIRDMNLTKNLSMSKIAMIYQSEKAKNNFTSFFSNAVSTFNYKMNFEEALRDYRKSLIDGNDRSFITHMNFMKNKYEKLLRLPSFPKIEFRRKLYLKRYEKEITLDYIQEIHEHVKKNPGKPLSLPHVEITQPSSITDKENALYLEKVEKDKKLRYVSTRLIYVSNLALKNDDKTSLQNTIIKAFKKTSTIPVNSLMIFIHGGGYIGGTTLSTEPFLRVWSNDLNIPIIGIDYNCAPKYAYPKALDDVWQAYLWIIKHSKEQFSINPQHIILAGDSAGGALCLSLTYLLIAHNLKLPDLVLLAYPGCGIDLNGMTNSQILILQDVQLTYNLVMFCRQSYSGNYQNKNDFFLNQCKAPDDILKKLPKTRFYNASSDPLRDDAIHLIEKIAALDVDCKAYEFKEYTHAFWNSHLPSIKDNAFDILLNDIREHFESINVKLPTKEEVEKEKKLPFL